MPPSNDPRAHQLALQRAERLFRGGLPRAMVDRNEIPVAPDGTPLTVRERDMAEAMDARFIERNESLHRRNQHLAPSGMFANVLAIIYPSIPYFGPDHGRHLSQLATYIAEVEGVRDTRQLEVVKAAGLLWPTGRSVEDPHKPDLGHALRSAEKADRFIRGDSTGTHLTQMRDAICRLLAQHTVDWKDPPQDPLARALSDAAIMELARFGPSEYGRRVAAEHDRKLLSPWCQKETTQRRWKAKYGW